MNEEKSLGQELIEAIQEALSEPGTGHLLKSKFDVKNLRKRLNLTQREFSNRYHIRLETLKNWEQGERSPDNTSIAYLTCIAKDPCTIDTILNDK